MQIGANWQIGIDWRVFIVLVALEALAALVMWKTGFRSRDIPESLFEAFQRVKRFLKISE